ncbi:MAG TPA: DUF4384 domain-containing protein [Anaeromyxobacteraceae bacterium]|nr:DUF4384 domain-containing protein [Anaeromyxobacteraceae bacterium]
MTADARGCPSDLRLEAHLLGPAPSGLPEHLEACARCRERLARMEREGEEFRRSVYPATVDAVVAAARPRRRVRWTLLLPVPAAIAAVAALVLLLRGDVARTRGDLGFAILAATPEGARPVEDGARVAADASVRFRVHPAGPCRLWVASVDAGGEIARIYPPGKGGSGAELAPGLAELPGGAVLDGKAGPQRFYAVCVPDGVAWPEVVRAVADACGKGAEAVRAPDALRGLPRGTSAATLLVEKGS